jgi:MSHA biogenesis protein MshG
MASFDYQGRDSAGNLVKGVMSARNAESVAGALLEKGIVPVDIAAAKKSNSSSVMHMNIGELFGVKVKDLIIFCRQMEALLKAGVPILKTLNRLQETTRSKLLAGTLKSLSMSISEGKTLANAMRDHPKVFSTVFVNVVDAAENSGQLDAAFKQMSSYLDLEDRTKKQVKKALRYPSMVLIVIIIAVLIVNFMVVPVFARMFASFNAELPWPTLVLVSTSNFLINYWLFILVGLLVIGAALYFYLKTPDGAYFSGKLKLKIPIIGSIIQRVILGRFARTFTMITQAGVPIVKGISLIAATVGNRYVEQNLMSMRDAVAQGASLSKSARETGLFTPLVLQMLEVGEEAGSVDQMLEQVADFYEQEVDYDLERLGELIEPVILLILGVLVFFLMVSIFLPMWDMVKFARM